MGLPKTSDWSDKVYNAGTRGAFNPLRDLERELHQAIPDLRLYKIGLFSQDDLKNVMTMGWRHMDYGHLDYSTVDDFNKAVGLRYGLVVDAHGHIMIGGNYVLIMPKDYRKKVEAERAHALNEQRKRANQASAYAHPSDPRAKEMRDAALELSEKTSETYKVQVSGEPNRDDAPRRGRPPKS